MPKTLSLKREIQRKFIHFSSAIIPIIILFIGRDKSLLYLGIITVLFLIVDFLKSRIGMLKRFYCYFFGEVIREHEIKDFTGASWVLTGCFLTLLIFPLYAAVFGMFVMSICDSFAAIIGKSAGSIHVFGKTIEGTIGFILSGFVLILILPFVSPFWGITAVFSSSFIELLPNQKINDNLSIPIVSAAVLQLNPVIS